MYVCVMYVCENERERERKHDILIFNRFRMSNNNKRPILPIYFKNGHIFIQSNCFRRLISDLSAPHGFKDKVSYFGSALVSNKLPYIQYIQNVLTHIL